jgi:hypothetical protein
MTSLNFKSTGHHISIRQSIRPVDRKISPRIDFTAPSIFTEKDLVIVFVQPRGIEPATSAVPPPPLDIVRRLARFTMHVDNLPQAVHTADGRKNFFTNLACALNGHFVLLQRNGSVIIQSV